MPVPHGVPWDKTMARPPELARGLKEHLLGGALWLWSLVAVRLPDPAAHTGSPLDPRGKASATICRGMKFGGKIRLEG